MSLPSRKSEALSERDLIRGSLKAGVQPANHNSAMFNRTAPIWEFLDGLSPQEDPLAAQRAKDGLHLIGPKHRWDWATCST